MPSKPSAVPPPVTAVIDRAGDWLVEQLGRTESALSEAIEGYGPTLGDDAGLTLRAGGKRLRPLLVLLCAGPRGGESAVRAATAIELIHMATLVHDDVLDDAPVRRGRPTVAAASGRFAATATGDLLFSRAFSLLGGAGEEEAVTLLSEASVALAQGEIAQRSDAFDVNVSEDRYLHRCTLKTARLFECACLLGLDAAPSGRAVREPAAAIELRRFGGEIGLAFQLLDDVLDVSGPPERTGKARGTDLLDGTVTLPLILARRASQRGEVADRATAERLSDLDLRSLGPRQAEAVCDAIAATGCLELVRSRGLGMVERAKGRLSSAAFDESRRRLLELVADGVVQRYS